MISRSHTPPPPWGDLTTTVITPTSNIHQIRRELLASQPELREYLAQLKLSQGFGEQSSHSYQQQQTTSNVLRDSSCLSNQQQVLREQQVRTQQRSRPMPPR